MLDFIRRLGRPFVPDDPLPADLARLPEHNRYLTRPAGAGPRHLPGRRGRVQLAAPVAETRPRGRRRAGGHRHLQVVGRPAGPVGDRPGGPPAEPASCGRPCPHDRRVPRADARPAGHAHRPLRRRGDGGLRAGGLAAGRPGGPGLLPGPCPLARLQFGGGPARRAPSGLCHALVDRLRPDGPGDTRPRDHGPAAPAQRGLVGFRLPRHLSEDDRRQYAKLRQIGGGRASSATGTSATIPAGPTSRSAAGPAPIILGAADPGVRLV